MVADLVHQHAGNQAVEVLGGLDPLGQDRQAIEEDQVGHAHDVVHAAPVERRAVVQPGQIPGRFQAEIGHRLVVRHLLHADADAGHVRAQPLRDGGERAFRQRLDIGDVGRGGEVRSAGAMLGHGATAARHGPAVNSRRA